MPSRDFCHTPLPRSLAHGAGANWEAVASYTDVSGALKKFDPPPPPPGQQRLTAAALDGGAAAADGKEGAAGGSKDVSKRATTEVEEPAGGRWEGEGRDTSGWAGCAPSWRACARETMTQPGGT